MNHHTVLKITSLLTIVLLTLHMASDTVRARVGTPEAGGSTLIAMPVLAILLYGTLLLDERRSGHVIMLIASLIALGMPILHVMGPTGFFTGTLTRSGDPYLFVWTLHALGVTGSLALFLAIRGLWQFTARKRGGRSSSQSAH